ncbi:hypothetical protein ZIOFF_061416 [Zingiber officinale]|uniref:DUF3741 domain-containing protein n=1 Tax=Zingiber officinale TaxID=94328 RepID=A0A8J5F3Z8_ZINOF|nr:hypothetical protein ZIOFF_061416 [Zingiber officinale]
MSLAIAERKAQQRQPGGFVGVFFHLLEWNRRLAKRKLFSRRKLLPPVRAVKAAKAFAADEKMPLAKLLLIDDENHYQGDFPSTKKLDDLGRGMRAPGLVARLMGLESMPVVAHERPRKATYCSCLANREESGGVFHRIDQDLRVESGGIGKQESRPQKLRKTGGFLERHPIDEGHGKAYLPGKKKKKTVLSSPSKNKLHKLPAPVKSSRLPPGRLMKAATRILEPGLQTGGRAKVAITYKDSSNFDAEGIDIVTTLKDSNESFSDSVSESSLTCRRLDDRFRFQPGDEETPRQRIGSSSFDIGNPSCSHAEIALGSFSSFALHGEQCNGFEMLKPVQSKIVMQNNVEELGQKNNQCACKTKLDRSSNRLRRNQLRQNQASGKNAISRDKVAFGTKVSSSKHGGRDANKLSSAKGSAFVVRNASKDSCSKLAYEQNSNRRELDTNTKKNMSHKRTISTFCGEHVETRRTTSTKQNTGINLSDRKGVEQNSNRSVSKRCIKSNSNYQSGDVSGFKSSDIFCFTLNSPIMHTLGSPSYKEKEKNRTTNGYINNIDCDSTLELDTRSNMISNRIATLRGDELRNLLEEKIKEFTSIDQDLLVRAARPFPCLEDLGTAFIAGQNEHKNTGACSEKIVTSSCSDSSCFPTQTQVKKKWFYLPYILVVLRWVQAWPIYGRHADTGLGHGWFDLVSTPNLDSYDNVKISPASVLDLESSQLSPISILEATFSNESCSIGSLYASSGGKLQFGLVESCNTPQSTDTENELLDSATSVDLRSIVDKIHLLNCITSTADDIHCDVGFSNAKLCESRHFASNAQLLFENFTSNGPEVGSLDISLESSLLDLLQAICDTLQIPTVDPCYNGLKGTDQLRELLFDCMIECLDSNYSCSSKSGFMTYLKIPFHLTREKLLEELDRQIREWMDLAGNFLDDLIKNGMKSSTEKWTVCKMEVFETGMDLESSILQTLVEETVTDFCWQMLNIRSCN